MMFTYIKNRVKKNVTEKNDFKEQSGMRILFASFAFYSLFFLTACDTDKGTDLQDNIDTTGFIARYDTDTGTIPFPNNILFSGTTDGTLNIPTEGRSAGEQATIAAVNNVNGFSTIGAFTAPFSKAINASTLVAGASVRVFEVTLSGFAGAVVVINRELEGLAPNSSNFATAEYAISLSSADTLAVVPLRPLTPGGSYLVALTSAITDNDGKAAVSDAVYAFAKSPNALFDGTNSTVSALTDEEAAALEPLRQATNFTEMTVEDYTITSDTSDVITDLAREDIIVSSTFTVQTVGAVLEQVRADIAAAANPVSSFEPGPLPINLLGLPGVGTKADFYKGSITVTSYRDTTNPLTTSWSGITYFPTPDLSPDPDITTPTQTIPLLISVPNADQPGSPPWPTVIFQHGITRERSMLLGVADALAQAGFAAVAIDMPLHGLAGSDAAALLSVTGVTERNPDIFSFDMNGNVTAMTPDGAADPSGYHFINLVSLLTSRDNLRQSVADLFSLRQALDDMDYDGGGPDFDTSNLYFVGHSLGAMVGTPFVRYETDVQHAVLAMPGGGTAKVLDGSAAFGPLIAAGLAANGVNKGTSAYEQFMLFAQTVLDTVDPINHASTLAASSKGLLVLEITGDDTNPSDLVIPNTVPDANDTSGTVAAPLAGTDPLATFLGTTKTDISIPVGGTPIKAWVQFNKGHHGSFITPNDLDGNADAVSAEVYNEMMTESATFLGSGALSLQVTDTANDIIRDQP